MHDNKQNEQNPRAKKLEIRHRRNTRYVLLILFTVLVAVLVISLFFPGETVMKKPDVESRLSGNSESK
jgi:hypothetical protein